MNPQDRSDLITALVVLVVGGAIVGAVCYLVQGFRLDRIAKAFDETGVPMNAAPAQTNPAAAPGRAHHPRYDPALRVHLCVGGCKAIVRNPGELCLTCFGAPAHRAEEITRQASRGGAAS